MIAIIDYGMGNLRSVQKAFEKVGAGAVITQNPGDIDCADQVVLPGVGAMQPAMQKLKELHLIDPIKKAIVDGKPFLGICLGLQLLFEKGFEGGEVNGLGIFPGTVERFAILKVPHMGWNQIKIKNSNCPLFAGINNMSHFYFCHSYYVKPLDSNSVAAATDYGIEFASAVACENVFGVQFHPEKSQTMGLEILKNFAQLKAPNQRSVAI